MQKFINIRSSQSSLKEELEKFVEKGWKVVNVSKGSELSRVMFSMKWTVTLENDAEDADEKVVQDIAGKITAKSWQQQICVLLGAAAVCGMVLGLVFGISGIFAK